MSKARIVSTGSYLPKKVLNNYDLEKMVDTNDEWITTRTGIKERHIADANESSSDMGIEAAKLAIKRANITPDQISGIICATTTPDHCFPSTACLIQKGLGAKNAFAFDLAAACSGFLYGLSVAESFIMQDKTKYVLVVGTEKMSCITDWKDRATCILFGDGAGAAILKKTETDRGILSSYLGSDGSLSDLLVVPSGGSREPISHKIVDERSHYIKMKGNEVFKEAVHRMLESSLKVIADAGLEQRDIKFLIPHQANLRIINAIVKRTDLNIDQIIVTLNKTGNTSAASIAISLDEACSDGRIKENDIIVLTAFGAGFTWGGMVLKV